MELPTKIFDAIPLTTRDAQTAFPLVHIAHPGMPLTAWLTFARRWTRLSPRRGGIMVLRDGRGYVHAVFTFRVEQNLRLGKFLRVADLIIGHVGGKALRDEILTAADRIAETSGCHAIVIEPMAPGEGLQLLRDANLPFSYLRENDVTKMVRYAAN